jgi:nucleotide-binding universal stress UspA family protein
MEARTVVVGADFADTGDEAIRAGLEQLSSGAAHRLYVVHVLSTSDALLSSEEPAAESPTASLVLESLSRRVRALARADRVAYREEQVQLELRSGDVLPSLLSALREHRADLAIVGTHGRRGIDRWLAGSVAETLVRCAACSVLIARPPRPPGRHLEREPTGCDDPDAQPEEDPWRPQDAAAKHPIP